jgi:glycosyltransferase involved in cell wall biosynthesis
MSDQPEPEAVTTTRREAFHPAESTPSPTTATRDRGRVAFFMSAPTHGGAERVTITIANGLAARGYDVDLVVASGEGDNAPNISPAVNVVDLDVPVVPGLGLLAAVPYVRSYLEANNPPILFSQQTYVNVVATFATMLADVDPYLAVTEHLSYDHVSRFKDRLSNELAARLYSHVDDVVAVSEGVAESVVANTRVDPAQITVLFNPVDVADIRAQAAAPVDHEWFTESEYRPIVSVGRLESQKDLGTLVRAFEKVHRERPAARLVLVGKGEEEARLRALVEELGLQDVVAFPGYVDNQYAYMAGSDVFALSSRFEGLPTVLIEALACGSSIVSTDCPHGPREILADGEYGRLTPVGDVDALAETLLAALDDPIPPERVSERVEAFSMEAGIDRYDEYIQRVLQLREERGR